MATNTATQPPITDSPWYWVYLFATAGLIALILAGPKFAVRQAQIEQNHEARVRTAQLQQGVDQRAEVGAENTESTRVVLWPLYVVLGCILGLAWFHLFRDRRRAMSQAPPSSISGEAEQ